MIAPLLLAAVLQGESFCFSMFDGEVRLAQVIAPKASFTPRREPAKPGTKPYVVRGDMVLAGPASGGYASVEYRNRANGCLPANALRYLRLTIPKLGDWAGEWERLGTGEFSAPDEDGVTQEAGATLTLALRRGKITVGGDAHWSFWKNDEPISPHSFEIEDVTGAPKGAVLDILPQEDCPIHLQRVGTYLVVTDRADSQHPCEGLNTSFTGIYTRKR